MRSFALEIVTPDRVFYTGPAQSLTVDTPLEDIDAQRAQEALARAKRHLEAAQRENNKYEIQRHVWALERAQARLRSLKGRVEARLGEEKPDGSGTAEGEHR